MAQSILLIDSYYRGVLDSLGVATADPIGRGYEDALAELVDFGFGTGGAYQRNLRAAGWRADVIVPNALGLQMQWARENGVRSPFARGWKYAPHLSRLPGVRDLLHLVPHLHRVMLQQVEAAQPDVVLVQDINLVPPGLAKEIRRNTSLLVGEIASPLPPKPYLLSYDLIVSALPSVVEQARSWNIPSVGVPLGFDERWMTVSPASSRPIDAIFVGSFSRLQLATAPLLRAVAERIPTLQIYGPASQKVLDDSGLAPFHRGPAWGRRMFELLGQSKLVVNRHGEVAGPYAVNMRMFETTGSGALLVTEAKQNLADLFEPGREVLAYRSAQEAADLAAAALAEPARLDAIARAGQERTLAEHTYARRIERFIEILEEHLPRD
ncbi:glycosyltransferase [Microbacterium sp. STN6]|uniref:glycosyltransferase family protein n=1 Tax=Microbacterium sp. STN6 TaxID=2995588 RepID=UPI002260976A|nr:glycosyltransferase [Microbacterium sp. STN6]MCX7521050.1 glycosyltransferase [Microbacterium sp. STN6]